ncbi:uncharacterized protein BBA_06438 [Beauveria bassiana ARSEF 2860]|uniref:Uncharacterized protein n=1 Tax=Beauveria bassiana (strain ARSEF 2860) TaxID=655819 RepID=J4KMS1_BEAB2|nr:uncharacterized protein BBA_06438 [Beauveria bassiana ARSEF 2860]EJP64444.1 hypothetical protein BBA_06438 [Beauveria bassiana ARSEF 2860]
MTGWLTVETRRPDTFVLVHQGKLTLLVTFAVLPADLRYISPSSFMALLLSTVIPRNAHYRDPLTVVTAGPLFNDADKTTQ